jgi:arylsulfatase A-like enzyme
MVSRREFLATSALAAGGDARPNIVFLLTDDQRWDTLGCMGNRIIRTPNVDRLAAHGITFRNNFCATAICCTSRASIFTGLLEKSHGISDFNSDLNPRIFAQSYPVLLRQAGYRMGFVGKYGVGDHLPADTFHYWRGLAGQAGTYMREYNGRRMHLTRIMEEQSVEFLKEYSGRQPFCLSVSFKAPHAEDPNPDQYIYDPALKDLYSDVTIPVPKTARPEYFEALPDFLKTSEARARWRWRFTTPERYQQMVKGYYRLISGVDDAVGRIVDTLEKLGIEDNTVVIFTSDNGYYLGEHGLADKWFMHEESIRTPLVIRDPRLPAGRRGQQKTEMSLNVDLAPTLLSLAGVERIGSMQGRDLMPLVRGEKTDWRREWFYSHHFRHERIPRSEGIRTARWAYMRYLDSKPLYEELYDLQADSSEERNLASSSQHSGELRKRWQIWNAALAEWRPDSRWADPA